MKKTNIGNIPLVYPLPAVLVGTVVNDKVNYTLLGNCGIISVKPSIVYISSDNTHHLNVGVHENKEFSINIPSAEQVKLADYCGIVSGKNSDKSMLFETFFEESNKAPLINECPVNMVCKVISTIPINNMEVFIAEVISTYVSQECLIDGKPDTKKIDPLIYAMDNRYWNIGDDIGYGFFSGKEYEVKDNEI